MAWDPSPESSSRATCSPPLSGQPSYTRKYVSKFEPNVSSVTGALEPMIAYLHGGTPRRVEKGTPIA